MPAHSMQVTLNQRQDMLCTGIGLYLYIKMFKNNYCLHLCFNLAQFLLCMFRRIPVLHGMPRYWIFTTVIAFHANCPVSLLPLSLEAIQTTTLLLDQFRLAFTTKRGCPIGLFCVLASQLKQNGPYEIKHWSCYWFIYNAKIYVMDVLYNFYFIHGKMKMSTS